MAKAAAYHAKARRDIQWEWAYLFENAGVDKADEFLAAVEQSAVMLLSVPHAGIVCAFSGQIVQGTRRFPIRLPFGTWLIFYVPTPRGVTIHRIVHGARDLKNYLA